MVHYCPSSFVSRQIYHRSTPFPSKHTLESIVYSSHHPNLVNASWLRKISRRIWGNRKQKNQFEWIKMAINFLQIGWMVLDNNQKITCSRSTSSLFYTTLSIIFQTYLFLGYRKPRTSPFGNSGRNTTVISLQRLKKLDFSVASWSIYYYLWQTENVVDTCTMFRIKFQTLIPISVSP